MTMTEKSQYRHQGSSWTFLNQGLERYNTSSRKQELLRRPDLMASHTRCTRCIHYYSGGYGAPESSLAEGDVPDS